MQQNKFIQMNIKISIIDDHPIVLQGLQNMLNAFSNLKVIGAYLRFEDLLTALKNSPSDILLMDIQMPGKSGIELAPEIIKTFPCLKIIALTNLEGMSYVRHLLQIGVKGYLLKTVAPKYLSESIESVFAGEEVIDESLNVAFREFTRKMKRASYLHPELSPREKEIVQLIAKGASSQEIAQTLFLGNRTVEFYRQNIMTKLDVNNAAALVHKALNLGIIL